MTYTGLKKRKPTDRATQERPDSAPTAGTGTQTAANQLQPASERIRTTLSGRLRGSLLMVLALVLTAGTAGIPSGCDDGDTSKHGSATNSGTNDGTGTGDGTDTNNSNDSTGLHYTTNLKAGLVVTQYGPVQGTKDGTVTSFLAIPYAAPPTGKRRWAPPSSPEPWSDPLDADAFPPMCPQKPRSSLDSIVGRGPIYSDDCPADCEGDDCCIGSEDCLYLNVWTTADSTSANLPVMVWIHGGAWQYGYTVEPWYDGKNLAARGIVVVSIQYRLGVLGYLAHADLTSEQGGHSGNYGIMDQMAALRWVKDNIRQFGGNPDNITVFGESAGAGSVCILLGSPEARGLFSRAIVESIACDDTYSMRSLDSANPRSGAISAHDQGAQAAGLLGCSQDASPLECMRSAPVLDIFRRIHPEFSSFLFDNVYKPIIDGYVLPDAPLRLIESGTVNANEVITGTNSNEMSFWRWSGVFQALGIRSGYKLEAADNTPGVVDKFHNLLTDWFGEQASRAVELWGDPATGADAVVYYEHMLSDIMFHCGARRHARAMSRSGAGVYRYVFTRVPPRSFGTRERMGAAHVAELKYVFGNMSTPELYYSPLEEEDFTLSDIMMRLWTSFAISSLPEAPEVSWQPDPDRVLLIDVTSDATEGYHTEQCDFIDEFRASPVCDATGGSVPPWACLF